MKNGIQLIMDDNSYHIIEDIDVKSSINTMKHNIISKANDWTISKIITQLKRNNIHNIEDYTLYSELLGEDDGLLLGLILGDIEGEIDAETDDD